MIHDLRNKTYIQELPDDLTTKKETKNVLDTLRRVYCRATHNAGPCCTLSWTCSPTANDPGISAEDEEIMDNILDEIDKAYQHVSHCPQWQTANEASCKECFTVRADAVGAKATLSLVNEMMQDNVHRS
eukprot:Blabericola_migrator_1__10562@NODE_5_length_29060_cov_171_088642_g4_i0_p21_GENE_NODE_5_length_29060_cov_171_088642_g4_i0NODE_5_length_29060_cov_171_088642_g4_i0_p21_ORF_typecomplete_len129_score20_38YgbA_NO/PF11756_8/0_085_NODE_5_length_29060_cov_171_088642_g4_i01812618512